MFSIQTDPLPIREEADGTYRVGQSRVLLELVINAFEDGATPESIVQSYPTLQLFEVYSVVAHYLSHREEIRDYLRRREERAAEVASRTAVFHKDMSDFRSRFLVNRIISESRDASTRGG